MSGTCMNNLTSALPSLVELRLETGYGSEPYWTVSSHQLKSLTIGILYGIYGCKNLEVNLNTPNLRYFSYKGPELIPSLNREQDYMNLKVLKLNLWMRPYPYDSRTLMKPANSLNSQWFLALRKYLGKLPQLEELTLELHTNPTKITFYPEKLRDKEIHPPSQVLNLLLLLPPLNINLPSIGAFLWSSHPITLSIELKQHFDDSFDNIKFIKFIYEEFMCLEENVFCCGDINSKCWRHYLKSVKIKSFYSIKDGQRYGEDSLTILADLQEGIGATFELQWLDT
uniref:uncharacterized protein LOC105351119 isoform X1 n=1 Tax=Fragaria vesca subsp. vesca TaxID=101020 RepID=UPI0005CB3571|nr:PREDICTED: uncharacterized protein LOC105351119 isoform X1 [Fragaria vesca subsp. vesca]